MKEDILEQLVDSWFRRQPCTFTKHNVKFKPDQKDIANLNIRDKSKYSVPSDIDVLAVHLDKRNDQRVSVVSCKSWQDGFDIDYFYEHLIDDEKRKRRVGTSEAWKKFRELVEPVWAKAFRETIFRETQTYDFTYYVAITKIKNNKDKFKDEFIKCKIFNDNLSDNGKHNVKIAFLTLGEMLEQIFNEKRSTTIESTEIGRFIQLVKAANLDIGRSTK